MELTMKNILNQVLAAAAVVSLGVACAPPVNSPDMAKTEEGAPCGPDALIEDGENADNQVIVHDGRAGYIYTYMDPEGTTISPKAGSEGGVFSMSPGGFNSAYAMRMNGVVASAKIVYAGMGLNMTDPKDMYDATKYK